MSGSSGPQDFSPGMLVDGIFIGGTRFHNGFLYPIAGWSFDGLGAQELEMESGNTVRQLRWLAGDAPINLTPIGFGISFDVVSQEDFRLIQKHAHRQVATSFWWDLEIPETWYVPGRLSAAQTVWKTARLLPWNLSGVTQITKPPLAYLDDVAQTIIPSGTPTAGQIVVPDAGGVYGDIVAPTNLVGTWLELLYRPQIRATIHGLRYDYGRTNVLNVQFEVHEHLANVYTAG